MTSSFRHVAHAVSASLRTGVLMAERVEKEVVISTSEDGLVCVVLTSQPHRLGFALDMLARQAGRMHHYSDLQVALNSSARVCVLWRPESGQHEDADAIATALARMMELTVADERQ